MKLTYNVRVKGEQIELSNNTKFGAYLEAMDHLKGQKLKSGDLFHGNTYVTTLKITYPSKRKNSKAS